MGFRIDHAESEPSIEDGVPVLRAGSTVKLRVFGRNFTNRTKVGLSKEKLEFGGSCQMLSVSSTTVELESSVNAVVEITLPKHSEELYFCATNDDVSFQCRNVDENLMHILPPRLIITKDMTNG